MERRYSDELKLDRKLRGYCAVWRQKTQVGSFSEELQPGCFAKALAKRDVVCLVDHDPGRLLSRTRNGSLRLREDHHGLAFEIDVPNTTLGKDVLALASAGTLGGCSVGFVVEATGQRWHEDHRTIVEADLREVSIVSCFPAYEGTSVGARSGNWDPSGSRAAQQYLAARRYLATCRDL